MKKFKIVGVIVLGVLILAELILSTISYHAGDIAEATYSLLWAVAGMFPFYNLMPSEEQK